MLISDSAAHKADASNEFISLAAHQLRTPLTSLHGYLKMLETGTYGELPDRMRMPVGHLLHATEQMRRLVNVLLEISRIERGKTSLQPGQVDLIARTYGLIEEVQAKHDDVKVNVVSTSKELMLNTDWAIAQAMISELLYNSFTYCHDEPSVDITFDTRSNRGVTVIVKDNGIGIPYSEQAEVFHPFFRASNVGTVNSSGNGLGLYYAQKCAQLLHTEILLTSHPEQGSTFWFTLPYSAHV